MKLSALITCKNEQDFVKLCIDHVESYVDEVIFVDNCSIDKSKEIAQNYPSDKIKVFSYPETQNMGELRQFSLDQAEGDWIIQIDCDEVYSKEAWDAILKAVKDPGEALSFRVGYHNLAWKSGHRQANFNHFPDRIYRRDVIDRYDGVLPNDMTKVKPEFYQFRPFLEYDNQDDRSFENPKQPILPVFYYHLARTRGYNFELNKWRNYNKNIHPEWIEEENERFTRENCWVSGIYDMEKIDVPEYITQKNIKNPLVSVIITCYNYGQYLEKAIWSCITQTVKPHEIIIVDDESTDNTEEVASLFLNYPGFKYIRQNKSGPAIARNNGAEQSTGDFLIFLDCDDAIKPQFIEKTLKKWRETESDVVITDMEIFGDISHIHEYPDFSSELLKQAQIAPSTCVLVDRHIWEQAKFNKDLWYDDYGWYLTMDKIGARFTNLHEPLFLYNRKQGSRVEYLDKKQEEGFRQLHDLFGKYI